jgi:hypothetical protein
VSPVCRTLELDKFIRQFDRHSRSLRAGPIGRMLRLVAE